MSKSETISAVTGIVGFVPSDIVASIFKFVTSNMSPTLYSVLWSVLITFIDSTVGVGVPVGLNLTVKVLSLFIFTSNLFDTTCDFTSVPSKVTVPIS